MTHCSTIKSYDYSWDSAYIVMGDAIQNRLRAYASPTPGPWKSMIIAEMVPTLSWTMDAIWNCLQKYAWATTAPLESTIVADMVFTLSWTTLFEIVFEKVYMAHSRTIEIYDYGWDGAHNVMDDAISNRLQKHAWPTPGPSNPWL